jgi:hypothetical protein
METVHILGGKNGRGHPVPVVAGGQGKLTENPMYHGVPVQAPDLPDQGFLAGVAEERSGCF